MREVEFFERLSIGVVAEVLDRLESFQESLSVDGYGFSWGKKDVRRSWLITVH